MPCVVSVVGGQHRSFRWARGRNAWLLVVLLIDEDVEQVNNLLLPGGGLV